MSTLATPQIENLASDSQTLQQSRSQHFHWFLAFWLVIFHAGAIAALFFFSWQALAVTAILWVLAQNVGIAMSYHRQLTHRGFTTPKWVEHLMAVCATLALQGGPIFWVAIHRLHHQLTDKPGDPHSPRDGKWWSHMGWMLQGSLHNHNKLLNRYVPDLMRDPFYKWLSRFHWVPLTLVGIGLLFAGGWPWVLWGVFFRVTMGLHVTWLVNSATHIWGSRRFNTHDDSRNSWWVALLSGGEGWHNNHHAHPVSASHGMAWYELDFNYWLIRGLGLVGLARRIKVLGPDGGPARILHP
ncbi:acyl-CoA desaturase [Silvibacterium acidisoli]|uniref:acyl-CoA desaturase n=1 Tax=Acidobacteriaceae bacterium ZG23-2 TaxID=2883246 RepID=UPI00406D15AB